MGKSKSSLTDKEKGAAFIAWYKETMAMEGFSGGMISRAQAARVLGISQVAVNRLIGRGFIRARHFPKDPDIEQIPVGIEDPFYHRLIGKLGEFIDGPDEIGWYEACYVSLDDVVVVWETDEQREKSRFNWRVFIDENTPPLTTGPHYKPPQSRGDQSKQRKGVPDGQADPALA